jgi:hypothetical protein
MFRRLYSRLHPRFFLCGHNIVWSNGSETNTFLRDTPRLASPDLRDVLRVRWYTRFLLPRIPAPVSTRPAQARQLIDTFYGTQH